MSAQQIECTSCGFFAPANLTFCPACGNALNTANAAPEASAPAPTPAPAPAPTPAAPPVQPEYMSAPPLPVNEQLIPSPMQQPQAAAVTVFCPKCGTAYGADLQFCPNCGTPRTAVGAALPVRTDAPTETKATNAMVAEIVGGLVGFLGIGHMVGGNVVLGAILLFSWWVFLAVMWGFTAVFFICIVFACPIHIGVPIASAMWARNNARDGVKILQ